MNSVFKNTMSHLTNLTNSNKDLRMKFNKKIAASSRNSSSYRSRKISPKKKNLPSKKSSVKYSSPSSLARTGLYKSHLGKIRRNKSKLPKFDTAKVICKNFGLVKGFCVNTHQGIVRNYNEDRVSILLNAQEK